jgi:hypothetical protein
MRGCVILLKMDGLMLARTSDARVCSSMPPRVCTVRGSGAGGSYLWTSFFRVCWLPGRSLVSLADLEWAGGLDLRLWHRENRTSVGVQLEVDSEESPQHNLQHLHPDHQRMMESGPESSPYPCACGAWKPGGKPSGDQMEPR